jgi:HlyD family secretion protein
VKKWLIAVGVIVLIAILVVLNLGKEGSKTEVEVEKVAPRTITKLVTASGYIKAKKQVNVTASAIGKVTKVAVREGDYVQAGDFLMQIDPTDYQTTVNQLEASIGSAAAQLRVEQANLRKAQYDYERAQTLNTQNVVSDDELRTAEINLEVMRARVKSAEETLSQQRATLAGARHDLDEVRITAEISGVVTTLSVEEGENAIMGTLNNLGTALAVIADLSEIEAEVDVDETEVVMVRVGQTATVALDAHPGKSFAGVVTEVGNSAVRSEIGLGQSSVDFKVVIAVNDSIPNVRPGLSASAKIKVAEEAGVLSIPIQCLTVRQKKDLVGEGGKADTSHTVTADTARAGATATDASPAGETDDVEGVFVVEDGVARYRPVEVGVAGSEHFQIVRGLSEGETVVSGPFKAINGLKDGDPVKVASKSSKPSKRE